MDMTTETHSESERRACEIERRAVHGDELFERAFFNTSLGVAIVHTDGRLLRVNDAMCRILGYSAEDLLQRTFREITHPQDLVPSDALVEGLLQGSMNDFQLEKRYIRSDGASVWACSSIMLVRNQDGEPDFFIAQVQDLSRRKLAESLLFESSTEMQFTLAPGGCIEAVTASWKHLGWSAEELIGRELFALMHDEDQETVALSLRTAMSTAEPQQFEARAKTATGGMRTVVWVASRANDGRLRCVAKRRASTDATTSVDSWLTALMRRSRDAVVLADANGLVQRMNDHACALFGTAHHRLGTHLTSLAEDGAGQAALERAWERALLGETLQEYETVACRSNGSRTVLSVGLSAAEGPDGELIGWLLTARDISAQKRIIHELAHQVGLYRSLIDCMPRGAAAVFDGELRLIAAQGELLYALDKSATAMVGKGVRDVTTPQNRNLLEQACRRALAGESSEFDVVRDGRPLHVRIAPVRDLQGVITGGLILSLELSKLTR